MLPWNELAGSAGALAVDLRLGGLDMDSYVHHRDLPSRVIPAELRFLRCPTSTGRPHRRVKPAGAAGVRQRSRRQGFLTTLEIT